MNKLISYIKNIFRNKRIEKLEGTLAYIQMDYINEKSKLKQKILSLESEIKNNAEACTTAYENIDKKIKKQNEKQNKINKEFDDKIEDLKSERYIVKKVSEGRMPKTQTMNIKSRHLQSGTLKQLKELKESRDN